MTPESKLKDEVRNALDRMGVFYRRMHSGAVRVKRMSQCKINPVESGHGSYSLVRATSPNLYPCQRREPMPQQQCTHPNRARNLGTRTHVQPVIERLMRHTPVMGDGCWEWMGFRDRHGYGRMEIRAGLPKPATKFVHRLAYKHYHPEWDERGGVLHSCDNPCCWNPQHLRVGDQLDNVRDMISRGRLGDARNFGSKNGRACVTEEQVLEIRARHAAGETNRQLAAAFNHELASIQNITGRRTWRHL